MNYKYKTIVVDLVSGRIIYVGEGKGIDALSDFWKRVIKNATTISLMYITLCCTGGLIISVSEGLPMLTCLFETASAVGTVGLSLGITPELNLLSRSVLILLMFFGRVGGLTLIFAALSSAQKKVSKLPQEKITVG